MIRVLLLADTHIGLDHPLRPRSRRPRRGPDLLAAFQRALEPARRREVDLVVHGGDLLNRSRPPAEIVRLALGPLLEVADLGVPVVLVPGNHERSALPLPMLALHSGLEVLDRPRTVELDVAGTRVAVGGFPCVRDGVRAAFGALLQQTRLLETPADVRLLALHQTVEGATVGPAGYCFRGGPDVIPGRCLPAGIAALLCGHIHRRQRLDTDLDGRRLSAPVLYPGATERTAFAERDEPKGYVIAELEPGPEGGRLASARFRELSTRPMVVVRLDATGRSGDELARQIRNRLQPLPADAMVQLRIDGSVAPDAWPVLRAASLHDLAPPTMILQVSLPRGR